MSSVCSFLFVIHTEGNLDRELFSGGNPQYPFFYFLIYLAILDVGPKYVLSLSIY